MSRLYTAAFTSYEGDNFVLDQQVVRAALKSHKILFSTKYSSASQLSPLSYYLRLLFDSAVTLPDPSQSSWNNPTLLILLLEWRAARLVQELAQNQSETDPSINQRVSKAVTEAFVATQVGEMINKLSLLSEEKSVVSDLYILVSPVTVLAAYFTQQMHGSICLQRWRQHWPTYSHSSSSR
jgi:acyl-CoA oxidase